MLVYRRVFKHIQTTYLPLSGFHWFGKGCHGPGASATPGAHAYTEASSESGVTWDPTVQDLPMEQR